MRIKKKIIFLIANDPLYFQQHLFYIVNSLIKERKFKVYLLSNNKSVLKLKIPNGAVYLPIPITRKPNLISDIKALIKLLFLIFDKKPQILLSFTHKGGLLATIATTIFRNSYFHVHTFTGQIWPNMKGNRRRFYKLIDKFIAYNSNLALADSCYQAEFLNENLCLRKKVIGLELGSLSGIDFLRFNNKNNKYSKGLSSGNGLRYIFLGRITLAKGVGDLITIIPKHLKDFSKDTFTFVGPCEDIILFQKLKDLSIDFPQNVFLKGFVEFQEIYLKQSNILILPSRREGFCNTVIEAGACGVPTIAYEIYGIKNAIKNNITGLLAKPFSQKDFATLMRKCSQNKEMVQELSKEAESYAKNFSYKKRTEIFLNTIVNNSHIKFI